MDGTRASRAVTIPTYDRLMWPTLLALKELGGSGSNSEIDNRIAEREQLSDEQLEVMHGRGRVSEVAYRSAWARTYLRQYGAIQQSARGVWAITDLGERLSQDEVNEVPRWVKTAYRERVANQQGVPTETTPDPSDSATAPLEISWKDTLLEVLRGMPPDAFERLAQRLLRECGFVRVEVTGRSGDGGIDGIGVLQMSLLTFPVFFQCKRYRGSVGAPDVRNFRGSMAGRTDKGLFITTGVFTREAEREASRDGTFPIELIDGDRLCDLLKDRGLGIAVRQVEEVTLDPSWFNAL